MSKTKDPAEAIFGTLVSRVVVNPKVEIHVKDGATNKKGVKCVNLAKYVKTVRYTGYAGGLMIPKGKPLADLKKALRKVD